MQIGDPIGEGWAIYKRFWRHLMPIALFIAVVVSLITLALAAAGGPFALLASLLVSLVGTFLITAALTEAVADVRDGRVDLSVGETIGRVWPRLGTVVGISLLAGAAITIGIFLVVVPGLYLLTIWSAAIPAAVLEKTGVSASLGRSRALVRGYGWTVFGVIFMTFLIAFIASVVLGIGFGHLGNGGHYVANVLSTTVTSPFIAAVWTSMYFRLRDEHEPTSVPPGAAYSEEPQQ